jgi:hypothetical protein
MNKDRIFLASTGRSLTRAEAINGDWQVTTPVENTQVNCLISDPSDARRVYAGTQHKGVLLSEDAGKSWRPAGMAGIPVKSLAISPAKPSNRQNGKQTLLAGCKPVSLYRSGDNGESWEELPAIRQARKWWWFSPAEPPDWRPYVQALTVSPNDPNVILAGIELGGLLRSVDGGLSWSKHLKGAELDCHSVSFHPTDGNWAYQGGGGGAAYSRDGGKSWQKPKDGLGRKYGWMVAADASQPEIWYFSASDLPKLWRGEFAPPAHVDGQANAHIYRKVGGAAWQQLSGGLPEPLDYMAYALLPDPSKAGQLYAGLSNGEVWQTSDYGDTWDQLPFNLSGIQRTMILI